MTDTIIIGGGMAGITAAYHLQEARIPHILLESSDRLGGRMKTDEVDGYRLDRGFQVFLTQYPEAKNLLDYETLDLHFFRPGAVVLKEDGDKAWIGDPFRDFKSLFPTLRSGIGTFMDKWRILKLRSNLRKVSIDDIFAKTELNTQAGLECLGFSSEMIHQFFAPFYRGIFLEDDLSTSRRMFEFVFKMFSEGFACIPGEGIEAIPKQIVKRLSRHDIKCNSKVVKIEDKKVILQGGDAIPFKNLIIATDHLSANKLLGKEADLKYRSTKNMYFEAENTSLKPQLIHLLPNGVVNNLCNLTTVADTYSKNAKELISISIRSGKEEVATEAKVKEEMAKWFPEAFSWKHIKTYDIHYALPDQTAVGMNDIQRTSQGYIICGDHTMNGSVNAAIKSGRLAAEAIINPSSK